MVQRAQAQQTPPKGTRNVQVLRGVRVRINPLPVRLACPCQSDSPNLTVHKENGLVKSFEYRCQCGRTDRFICE
jgi:hypothetical protein